MIDVDRERVQAYRYAAQQLDRSAAHVGDLAVLSLGVPDSPAGSAAQSVRARVPGAEVPADLVLAWSVRGSPHLHRPADLPALARQLYPTSDADVVARMPVMRAVDAPLRVFARTVAAMREHARETTDRGTLSAAVTAEVPEASAWCQACGATHVFYSPYLQSGLAAGVRLVRRSGRLQITATGDWTIPQRTEDLPALVEQVLRLQGPGSVADVAAFLGTSAAALRPSWPEGLAEVSVDGRRAFLPPEATAALESPPPARGVRLLPPGDPFLRVRDRAQLLPDPGLRALLWRATASPGALLVDGAVRGTWRARKAGRELQVAVTAFGELTAGVRAEVEIESQQLAATRGAASAAVVYDSI